MRDQIAGHGGRNAGADDLDEFRREPRKERGLFQRQLPQEITACRPIEKAGIGRNLVRNGDDTAEFEGISRAAFRLPNGKDSDNFAARPQDDRSAAR
jgi:hypothetical protein